MDALTVLAVSTNVLIMLGYLGIGMYVAPKFPGKLSLGLQTVRVSGLLFFVTCAISHLDMAIHAAAGTPLEFTVFHYLLDHGVQAIAAPVFLVCAVRWMNLSISDRE